MKRAVPYLAIIVATTLQSPFATARADTITYLPSMALQLGSGYNKTRPSDALMVQCVNYDSVENEQGTNLAEFTLEEVNDRSELYGALEISSSLDASFAFHSGTASTLSGDSTTFSDNSITWIAKVRVEFGSSHLQNPSGLPAFQRLSSQEIRDRCGTSVVLQETKGTVAAIVFSFDQISRSDKHNLEAAISASAGFFDAGGSLSVDYKTALQQVRERSALNISVHVQGGPGSALLQQVALSSTDLSTIRNALSSYIQNSNIGNAKPLRYLTRPLSQFGYHENELQPSYSDDFLSNSLFIYQNLERALNRIRELTIIPVRPEDQYLNTFVTREQRTELLDDGAKYAARMQLISIRAKDCINGASDCTIPNVSDLPVVRWPNPPPMLELVPSQECYLSAPGVAPVIHITNQYTMSGLIYGNKSLLGKLYKVDSGQTIPMAIGGPFLPPQGSFLGSFLSPDPFTCKNYNPPLTNAIGGFQELYDGPLAQVHSLEIHLQDRLGRDTVFRPTVP